MLDKLKMVGIVLLAIVVGSLVNIGLVGIFPSLIPPPEGADTSTMDTLSTTMHLFEPKHFIGPFVAHAMGTLVAAYVATMLLKSHQKAASLVIGVFFLLGGITAATVLPAPLWFEIIDLVFAYIPMAMVGHGYAEKNKARREKNRVTPAE